MIFKNFWQSRPWKAFLYFKFKILNEDGLIHKTIGPLFVTFSDIFITKIEKDAISSP